MSDRAIVMNRLRWLHLSACRCPCPAWALTSYAPITIVAAWTYQFQGRSLSLRAHCITQDCVHNKFRISQLEIWQTDWGRMKRWSPEQTSCSIAQAKTSWHGENSRFSLSCRDLCTCPCQWTGGISQHLRSKTSVRTRSRHEAEVCFVSAKHLLWWIDWKWWGRRAYLLRAVRGCGRFYGFGRRSILQVCPAAMN